MFCQQQWNRKKLVHGEVTHALSFLQNEGIQPLSVILNTSSSTDVLDLQSGIYTKPESVHTGTLTDSPEIVLYVKDHLTAYHE